MSIIMSKIKNWLGHVSHLVVANQYDTCAGMLRMFGHLDVHIKMVGFSKIMMLQLMMFLLGGA